MPLVIAYHLLWTAYGWWLPIRKHEHLTEDMIVNLQRASDLRLTELGHREMDQRTWLGGGGWKVFLDHPDEVRRTIKYVGDNPVKMGLPAQNWDFTKPYDGWPLHPGHNPNSRWARGIRNG